VLDIVKGDILHADADAVVNTVNCVGVMGRGIALQFRRAFPENFRVYQEACKRGELRPGMVLTHKTKTLTRPYYVINFPTKTHWKGKSKLEYIEFGLRALVEEVKRLGIRTVAVPPLGCGLGGLRWSDVRPLIEQAFEQVPDVHVLLYQPSGAPGTGEMVKDSKLPAMTSARAILLSLMYRYQAALMDVSISLLEIHKLMYFAQEAGQELKLQFRRGYYGPYAEKLRHALIAIDGHFISGYGDGEDKPTKSIDLDLDAAQAAIKALEEKPEVRERVARVGELIEGFETPFGMELLATVHWVAVHEGARTPEETIKGVYAWGKRKKMFSERQIRVALNVLKDKGWLSGTPCLGTSD